MTGASPKCCDAVFTTLKISHFRFRINTLVNVSHAWEIIELVGFSV